MATTVVNKHSRAMPHLWRGDPQYVDIMRGTHWGNDWSHLYRYNSKYSCNTREESVLKHKEDMLFRLKSKEPGLREALLALKGKTLVCCCKPLACHGDTLIELISMIEEGQI